MTSKAAGGARRSHSAVVFNDRMYVLGGHYDSGPNTYNDVWWSTDGVNWTAATYNAAWSARGGFGCVVFNNKMWVIGGYSFPNGYGLADVWSSSDGVTWTQATSYAAFGTRVGMGAMVFDNKMYVVAGWDGSSGGSNDLASVYYSTDGATWTQATNSIGSSGTVGAWGVHDNKMWVVCFTSYTDWTNSSSAVYSSSNGVNWTYGPAYPQSIGFQSGAEFRNNLYVMNGYGNWGNVYNNVYHLSSDVWNP